MRERAKRLRRELSTARGVSASHHGDEAILQQCRAPEALANGTEGADAQLERSAVETVEDVEGPARAKIELYDGRRGRDRGHQRRRHDDRRIVVDGDRKAPVRLRRHERLGLEGVLHLRESMAQREGQLLRARGRHHPFGRADEQLILQQIPQAVQGMAQSGLTHAEPPPRTRHAALSKQAVEHHEQVEIEGPPIHLRHLHVTRMNLLHCSATRSVRGGNRRAVNRRGSAEDTR